MIRIPAETTAEELLSLLNGDAIPTDAPREDLHAALCQAVEVLADHEAMLSGLFELAEPLGQSSLADPTDEEIAEAWQGFQKRHEAADAGVDQELLPVLEAAGFELEFPTTCPTDPVRILRDDREVAWLCPDPPRSREIEHALLLAIAALDGLAVNPHVYPLGVIKTRAESCRKALSLTASGRLLLAEAGK